MAKWHVNAGLESMLKQVLVACIRCVTFGILMTLNMRT